jgi:hypothetical protein
VFDSETSPGVLAGGLALLNMIGLLLLWRRFARSPPDIEPELTRQQFERRRNERGDRIGERKQQTQMKGAMSELSLPVLGEPINLFPLWVAVVLFFVMGTVFSTFEAIAPLVSDTEYQ